MIAYYHQILADEAVCMKVIKRRAYRNQREIWRRAQDRNRLLVRRVQCRRLLCRRRDDYHHLAHGLYQTYAALRIPCTKPGGGVGAKGSNTREEDFIEYIYPASMHNYMLFFTQKGKCYWLKVYEIPEGSKSSKGRAIQNMLNIDSDDKVNAFIRVKRLQDPEYNMSHNLLFCTRKGIIKKTKLEAYSRPRQNGRECHHHSRRRPGDTSAAHHGRQPDCHCQPSRPGPSASTRAPYVKWDVMLPVVKGMTPRQRRRCRSRNDLR